MSGDGMQNTRLRILLACQQMKRFHDLKAMLSSNPHVQIVGEVTNPIDVLLEVARTRAQLVVIDLPPSGDDPGLCSHLLSENPEATIVAVSYEGDKGVLYETGVLRTPLVDASPQGLMQLFRSLGRGAG